MLAPQAGFLPPLPTALHSAHTSEQIPTHSEEKGGLTRLHVRAPDGEERRVAGRQPGGGGLGGVLLPEDQA